MFAGTVPHNGIHPQAFFGDLRDKYYAQGGGAGTYTRRTGQATWTKQGAAAAQPTAAQSVSESDFEVTKTATAVTITKYTGKASVVNIPARIQNLPVTGIGIDAFEGNENITSVTIPSSLPKITNAIFENCTGLTSVTFQGTISSDEFADDAFPGDLRAKFYTTNKTNGTPGTYTRTNGTSTTWTKK
jgi:hypothetical protein